MQSMERRSEVRMLCADMVEVSWSDDSGRARRATALLEDIARSGACLQFEHPVPIDTEVRIKCPNETLEGTVRYCVYREIGYFVGVKFSPGFQWSRRQFEPEHLLDLEEMMKKRARKPARRVQ